MANGTQKGFWSTPVYGMSNICGLLIYNTLTQRKTIVACFLDLSSAYVRVNLRCLENNLRRLEIPQSYIYIINQLLFHRDLYVLLPGANTLLGPHRAQRGISQGSLLSPLLFNIYSIIPPGLLVSNIQIMQYADEFCILSEDNTIESCVAQLNSSLNNLAG